MSSIRKDVLPPHHINSVVYKFECSYGCDYIGKISQCLDFRIKQHLPARILNPATGGSQLVNTSGSSIAQHAINGRECVYGLSVDHLGRTQYFTLKHYSPFTLDLASLLPANREIACWV